MSTKELSDVQAQSFAYELTRLVGGDLEFSLDEAKAIHKTALLFAASGAKPAIQGEPAPWTEKETLTAIQSIGRDGHGKVSLTYESGPYDIDRPTNVAGRLAAAIVAARDAQWIAASPQASPDGGEATSGERDL